VTAREDNKKFLESLPKEKLIELMFTHIRGLWTVDGLYFLGIEEKNSTEAATEVDTNVWRVMGKIEARRLKEVLGIKDGGLGSLAKALRSTSWYLDLDDAELVETGDSVIVRNLSCRVQKTRIGKGLPEFACKSVRSSFFSSFAKEFNPDIEMNCKLCPPDKHSDSLWCEWEFRRKRA
jgi:hypothetical protein